MTQEHTRIGSAPALVGIGEMHSYITQSYGAQDCIGQSMERHIGIAVPEKSHRRRNIDSTDNAGTVLYQTVNVESVANSHVGEIHCVTSAFQEGRADRPYRM